MLTDEEARQVVVKLAHEVGLDGDNLGGLLALISTRKTCERVSHGLLNGTHVAAYHGPRDEHGQILRSGLLDARHYVFTPCDPAPATDWSA